MSEWQAEVAATLGSAVRDIAPLSGGCIGQVYRLRLADGETVVAKVDERPSPALHLEAFMLRYLTEHSDLPLPAVLHATPRLLLLEFCPGNSHFSGGAPRHAAELLAALHQITAPAYGLEQDTLIGSLPQPNPWTASWVDFFRRQRLLLMAQAAADANRLPRLLLARLERFAADLERWLVEPERPSLIHGDVWTTNVLAQGGQITAFLDPANYYADPEIELAFITLFGTFGRSFFDRYREIRPIGPNFFETRRDIYNLYPLLVHVRLFGGSYVSSVARILERFGY